MQFFLVYLAGVLYVVAGIFRLMDRIKACVVFLSLAVLVTIAVAWWTIGTHLPS